MLVRAVWSPVHRDPLSWPLLQPGAASLHRTLFLSLSVSCTRAPLQFACGEGVIYVVVLPEVLRLVLSRKRTRPRYQRLTFSLLFFCFLCYDIIFDYHFLVDSGCRPFCFPFSFVASTKNNNPFQLPSKDPATLDTRNDPRKKKTFP